MIDRSMQARYLWLFSFCYVIVVSLLFQKIVLPLLPSLHGGSGLLMHDAIYCHRQAVMMADAINSQGWSAWFVFSAQLGTSGNVAMLAALYAIFSVDPALIIPVNAFFHATGAVLILLIGRELWPKRVGNIAGLIAAVLFVISPTALSWYSQPLKETYVFAGILLILYSYLRALRLRSVKGGMLTLVVWMAGGLLLIFFIKPYYLRLLLGFSGLIACVVTANVLWSKHPQRYGISSFYFLAMVLVAAVYIITKPYLPSNKGMEYKDWVGVEATAKIPWQWEHSSWLPASMEKYLEIPAKFRESQIRFNQQVGANSTIDANEAPHTATEVILYLPRVLQIAMFAPFPNTWMKKLSVAKAMAIGEMLLWYCLVPGLFFALYFRRSLGLTVVLLFAVYFLTIFSFVTPNVGTLLRYRYAYEFLLILVAVAGWVELLLRRQNRKGTPAIPEPVAGSFVFERESDGRDTKKYLLSSATVVSIFTLIVSMGFFGRDLIMTRWFGAGIEMDIFFLGAMFPMFFTAVLAMPAGATIIPAYANLRKNSNMQVSGKFIGSAILHLMLLLGVISLLLHFLVPSLLSLLNLHYSAEQLARIQGVTDVYLVIMLLGGLVIISNAVLNAEGRVLFPIIAQMMTPVIAIVSLLLFGSRYGIYAAIYGMLLGLFVNFFMVLFALWRQGLLPVIKLSGIFLAHDLPFRQYLFLVAAALFTALSVPVSNSIAAHLPEGSVAIVGLGMKVILLITGVIGAGITTILLPYFSNLVAKHRHNQAQSDLSFFLLFVTLLSVPIGIGLMVLVEPVTQLVFANSALTEIDIQVLVRVIQYGVIQLPFFICGLVAIKYITAYQRSGIILLSSFVGLVLSAVLGMFFIRIIGAGGVSLAMTLAIAVSAAILILYANNLKHLSIFDSIFIVFNWAIYLTLIACLHYRLDVGVVIASIAYIMLVTNNWNALIAEWRSNENFDKFKHS